MKVSVNTSGVARLAAKVRALAEDFGRGWTASLVLSAAPREPYPNADGSPGKARSLGNADLALIRAARSKLFEVTPEARDRILRVMGARWREGLHNVGALMLVGASEWRAIVVERAAGGDSETPNTEAWAARKRRLGLDPRPGRASGQLEAALRAARVEIRKAA